MRSRNIEEFKKFQMFREFQIVQNISMKLKEFKTYEFEKTEVNSEKFE